MLNEIEIISRRDTGHSNMVEILRVRRPSDKKEAVILWPEFIVRPIGNDTKDVVLNIEDLDLFNDRGFHGGFSC